MFPEFVSFLRTEVSSDHVRWYNSRPDPVIFAIADLPRYFNLQEANNLALKAYQA